MISRFAKAIKLAHELAVKAKSGQVNVIARFFPKVFFPTLRMDAAFRRAPLPPGRNPFLRMARVLMKGGRAFRPFTSLTMTHQRQMSLSRHNERRFQPFIRSRHILRQYGILEKIRDVFSTNARYNKDLIQESVPTSLDAYEIGENIGYGSNAAVYALRVREREPDRHSATSAVAVPSSTDSLKVYPLALKLMFNYELDRGLNDDHLWRSMGAELVPLPDSSRLVQGRMGNYRPLPIRHPNVVRLFTAFVDRMPLLPDARQRYPEALPTAPFYEMVIHEPKTMFLVMKRYRMTLRDYVLTQRRNYWTGRVLLGQLLEGCVFLHDHVVAQRDMKSDNILLEFDHHDDVPHLVISDFGCALANGNWTVPYQDDTLDLGGNLATRAPEIRTARAHPDRVVNFEMADTWAAGGLAYEIFTRRNPFYSLLSSDKYIESEVPKLPSRVHYAVRGVVRDMLKRNPNQRPLPHVAANVVCLSLFRFGGDVRAFLGECGISVSSLTAPQLASSISRAIRRLGAQAERALDGVIALMAAESMIARGLQPPLVSDAEQQLRATFLSRVNRDQMWQAVGYFFEGEDKLSFNCIPAAVPANGKINGISTRVASR